MNLEEKFVANKSSFLFIYMYIFLLYHLRMCSNKNSSLLKGSATHVVPWFDKKEKEKKNNNKEGDE